ncbi:MAG: energy transducer TonB [Candidatus Korobacteraceae bacterium]|jgi:protein TonB
MRLLSLIAIATWLLLLPVCGRAQTNNSQSSTASPADDPAFASFQPVTKGIKPPKATSAPDPKFPDLPADAEPRGTVVMLIGVNTKGHVEAVRVLRSDEQAFETTAVATMKKWKFKPAQKDGRPVPVQITVEMKFQR